MLLLYYNSNKKSTIIGEKFMITKLIEIRDSMTKIVALAIKTFGETPEEERFFRADGFGKDTVMLMRMERQEAHYDPFAWSNRRTMTTAHRYIQQHFDELPAYGVVDVEYILGETDKPKASEIWRAV